MLCRHALRRGTQAAAYLRPFSGVPRRALHNDGRNRLSTFWTPSLLRANDGGQSDNGHDLLLRAGFLRQAHSGIFHLLPLGLRVQDKIERLIDKHMRRLGAAKVSLSSLSSEELWTRSARLEKGRSSELLRLQDRKGAKYLLSPTHEEEITTVVANAVHSYKDLPLRLYQVSRKYRDELRPRQGLLRGREFLMKDLYTFDVTRDAAKTTYDQVRTAYTAFFEDLKLPYLTAAASSGNMGGDLSHEYHLASPNGEDTIISCDNCDFSTNEEIYVGRSEPDESHHRDTNVPEEIGVHIEPYISKDRKSLCYVHYPEDRGGPNVYAAKKVFPDIDTGISGEHAVKAHHAAINNVNQSDQEVQNYVVFDPRLPDVYTGSEESTDRRAIVLSSQNILMTKAQNGDICTSCKAGHLQLHQAVEIGHTFYLGSRYSEPLSASVLDANNKQVAIEMGCHGIGISRLIGAAASVLADSKGLNWPLRASPFELLMVPGFDAKDDDVRNAYDLVLDTMTDAVLDDRDKPLGWKLKDADLVGYPIVVVLGRRWKEERIVELQCRRLGVREQVLYGDLTLRLQQLRKQL